MFTPLPQRAQPFAEGVFKATSPDSSEDADGSSSSSSAAAAAAAAAVKHGVSSLCRTLGLTEPQSVAVASRSLHFADTGAAVSAPQFTTSDVSSRCHRCGRCLSNDV